MTVPFAAVTAKVRRLAVCSTLAAALALGAAPLAAAGAESAPEAAAEFVKSLFDRARHLSATPESRDPERLRQLVAFVRGGVDLVAIARFSTGPFWKQASDEERDRFLALLETFIAQTFDRRLGELTGRTLSVVKAVAIAPAADESRDMLVVSRFTGTDNRALGVDWRVRMSNTGPRIVDLVVEGISMAVAQRDEFITVIRNGGGKFAALLTKLEEWTANPDDALAQRPDLRVRAAGSRPMKH
ncbi:MAG TPA: ABC transporter substrate-binding protein [Alphaproteobacteria bacterium]|jgi:phospholipid transport system substrate-binding protein|nr:ABC transporter substrate-binding protein [Alphaproteobacteria bacterium]